MYHIHHLHHDTPTTSMNTVPIYLHNPPILVPPRSTHGGHATRNTDLHKLEEYVDSLGWALLTVIQGQSGHKAGEVILTSLDSFLAGVNTPVSIIIITVLRGEGGERERGGGGGRLLAQTFDSKFIQVR